MVEVRLLGSEGRSIVFKLGPVVLELLLLLIDDFMGIARLLLQGGHGGHRAFDLVQKLADLLRFCII